MIPVTFRGYQERLDGTSFDKKKHYLIPKKENKNANPKKR